MMLARGLTERRPEVAGGRVLGCLGIGHDGV